jgi:hypothetical protein
MTKSEITTQAVLGSNALEIAQFIDILVAREFATTREGSEAVHGGYSSHRIAKLTRQGVASEIRDHLADRHALLPGQLFGSSENVVIDFDGDSHQ